MPEYTQTPSNQVPIAITIPAVVVNTLSVAGALVDQTVASQSTAVGTVGFLQITIPPLALDVRSMAGGVIDSLRDSYLANANCPKLESYPLWGQRGHHWNPAII
jgi:hypothetical protein